MTSWLMAGAGLVALFCGSVGTRYLVHWWHQEHHAQRAAGPPWEPVPAPEGATLVLGSMTLDGEREIQAAQDQHFGTHFMLHGPAHRDPACFWCGTEELERAAAAWPADPVPWEDLQSGARIEDDRDGDQTAAWFHELGEDPGPGVVVPSHGCPAPGPVQNPTREGAQGWAVRAECASESRPAARADLTGSLPSRLPKEDPGQVAHIWPGPSRLASAADVDAARPWLDVQLEDLYVWVRGVLAA